MLLMLHAQLFASISDLAKDAAAAAVAAGMHEDTAAAAFLDKSSCLWESRPFLPSFPYTRIGVRASPCVSRHIVAVLQRVLRQFGDFVNRLFLTFRYWQSKQLTTVTTHDDR